MHVNEAYVRDMLSSLVRINSVNPAFTGGATDERTVAAYVTNALEQLGLQVTRYADDETRPSVVGRLPGGDGPSVMLYAHYDTVGVDGMARPFSGALRDGKLYGRGAYDMKGGLAACLGAVQALREADVAPAGDVLVAAVADEEVASLGMREVLRHMVPDAAIVTEPTDLRVCVAHKGFCWITVEIAGRAAHGSRFDLGVDANMRMGRFLVRLEALERELRTREPHRLVGPPSLHAAVLHGGTGPSTYADRSTLRIERRTVPGETVAKVLDEINAIVRDLVVADPELQIEARLDLARDPFEVAPDAAVVRAVRGAAAEVLGGDRPVVGQTPWMDAAFLAAAGVETVVMGPLGGGAHAVEEWVDVESVVQLSNTLVGAIARYQA